jgi:tRNA threonylcarbamoyladenosine biosynthesis protein TsaB
MSGNALTLAVDASTYRGTVAVLTGQQILATSEVAMRGEREERLMPAIASALGTAGASAADVGRVVVGGGPGSFTSLRIGAALA